MMDTRLLGSGALSALALMLAAGSAPASAVMQVAPDMMIAPDGGPAPASAPEPAPGPAPAAQERGRGGRDDGGRSWGGRSWGGRSWGGGAMRSGDAGGASAPRGGGGYERGARGYSGPYQNYSASSSSYAGQSGAYNGAAGAAPDGRDQRRERAGRAAFADERAAINRGDIQAPPSYGEGNRTGAASPYVRTDNLAAQGVKVAGAAGSEAAGANLSDRRGAVERGVEWRGGRRGDNWRGNEGWRGDRRGGNWSDRRGDWRGNDGWRGDRRDWRGNDGWRGDRRGDWRGNDGWRDNRRDWRGGRQFGYDRGWRDGRHWDRGWRDNRRFNWIGHRQANRFLFAPGPYFAPFSGHFYRPVRIGFFLDPLFFQPRFFLTDPWAYRLPPAGDRFRWVRYYDDVLLVDVFTGEVVDVIENFFW